MVEMKNTFAWLATGAATLGLLMAGCNSTPSGSASPSSTTTPAKGGEKAAGSADTNAVNIDGSNTVYPITSALQESMGSTDSKITIGHAGTGAGFTKFINGEIDICDASRVIKKEEDAKLKEKGIEYYEIAIAYDGLSIIVNSKNKALDTITTAQLKALWNKDSKAKTWKDVNPAWPATPVKLYGPTSEHGTYEYFNEAINGDKANTRTDYSQQSDYDALITNVSRDENALAYVGYSFASLKKDSIKILKVDGGKGPIEPDEKTIMDGTYAPLSRPLLMYVSKKAYETKPGVKAFVTAALTPKSMIDVVKAVNYVPLPDDAYTQGAKLVEAGKTGSHLMDAKPGASYADIVAAAVKG
jgi:phosphate transport system substrate-binding protein